MLEMSTLNFMWMYEKKLGLEVVLGNHNAKRYIDEVPEKLAFVKNILKCIFIKGVAITRKRKQNFD